MIKSNIGSIEIKGTRAEIYADLCTIIFSLYNDEVLDKEDIEEACTRALISEEEADEQMVKITQELLDKIKEKLSGME